MRQASHGCKQPRIRRCPKGSKSAGFLRRPYRSECSAIWPGESRICARRNSSGAGTLPKLWSEAVNANAIELNRLVNGVPLPFCKRAQWRALPLALSRGFRGMPADQRRIPRNHDRHAFTSRAARPPPSVVRRPSASAWPPFARSRSGFERRGHPAWPSSPPATVRLSSEAL